jgi:hypothetical protein
MNIIGFAKDIVLLIDGTIRLTIESDSLNCSSKDYNQFANWVEEHKRIEFKVEPHRNRRSLNANAYMWVLLEKLATTLNTDKDSLYLEMLDRYGVFTHIIVKPEVVDRVKAEWRTVSELGEVSINGKTGIQLQCYFGSSTYNTAEMARLIDGVVSECEEVGIDTLPPAELESMKSLWEGNK